MSVVYELIQSAIEYSEKVELRKQMIYKNMKFYSRIFVKNVYKFIFVVVLVFLLSTSTFMPASPSGYADDSIAMTIARVRGPLAADDEQAVAYLRSHFLKPPATKPYNLSKDASYQVMSHGETWRYIHDTVKKLFDNQPKGFFVEAGALDGEFLSNTLWLEKNKGWNGLLVEADKNHYHQLLQKGRKAWSSNTCLSIKDYPQEAVFVTLNKHVNSKGFGDNQASKHPLTYHGSSQLLETITNDDEGNIIKQRSDKTYSVVQCFPFYTYLLALNITTIDFLSLDVEGAEKAILSNFPWDKINIRTFVLENSVDSFDYDLVKVMNERGYLMLSTGGNSDYFFVRQDDPVMKNVDFQPTQVLIDSGVKIVVVNPKSTRM